MNAVSTQQGLSVIADMAMRFGMDRRAFEATLMATVMPAKVPVSNEQVAAFLLVAKKYNLNPFTKDIYAFPSKGGGIQPMVPIDGWMKIINEQESFDGMEFVDQIDEKGPDISAQEIHDAISNAKDSDALQDAGALITLLSSDDQKPLFELYGKREKEMAA